MPGCAMKKRLVVAWKLDPVDRQIKGTTSGHLEKFLPPIWSCARLFIGC